MGDGQDTGCRHDFAARDNHGAVVQRAVFEEYVLNQPLRYASVDGLARADEVGEGNVVLDDDEGAHLLLAHVDAGHHDGEDDLTVVSVLVVGVLCLFGTEEAHQAVGLLVGPKLVEEVANLLLEQDDEGNGAHVYKLVEHATQDLHLQNLRYHNPEADEDEHSIEDVDGARAFHHLVAIIEDDCYRYDVDKVFQAKGQEHNLIFCFSIYYSLLIFATMRMASAAARTSWTRSMSAPRSRASV